MRGSGARASGSGPHRDGAVSSPELVVFDTDILIDAGRGAADALQAISRAELESRAVVSAVTHMELGNVRYCAARTI